MSDFLICEECDNGTYNVNSEENKVEEYLCVFCKFDSEAECLVDGQPSCVNCKMNRKSQHKSPCGSIRSDSGSVKGVKAIAARDSLKVPGKSIVGSLIRGMEMHGHKRGDSSVSVECFKAHKFLQKYTTNNLNELVCLYNSVTDGISASAFHAKCDDCKHGIIVIIKLTLGYEIAGFSWKGIRKGISQVNDSQMGGVVIKNNSFEFSQFQDKMIYSLPEGIRFSTENDLYLNFDDMAKSLCGFDPRLKSNQLWTTYIEKITAYKLHIVE